jgi:hypothetical protein
MQYSRSDCERRGDSSSNAHGKLCDRHFPMRLRFESIRTSLVTTTRGLGMKLCSRKSLYLKGSSSDRGQSKRLSNIYGGPKRFLSGLTQRWNQRMARNLLSGCFAAVGLPRPRSYFTIKPVSMHRSQSRLQSCHLDGIASRHRANSTCTGVAHRRLTVLGGGSGSKLIAHNRSPQ